ncbi:DNA cytosine methyltransferase [Vibrio quintilis]|uniref:DNA (cytosine-5-)-methyltransferase n=1 Tax=Vibrio quintilis TaxID=1117707 RepID=A0A1M7YNS3_9VIBR|nr:DNA cytosine methyltransferase [Vibrio quintilis]SHO54314.1 putative BsuMI modification methylase subunit YdiP [Vibrio quintilis]
MNVLEVTNILKAKGLVKDVNGTRRFIRKGELVASKECNHDGYQLTQQALDAFLWVKQSSDAEMVQHILNNVIKLPKAENPFKVASFFAGIGGFDLGCERAGMEVVFQCEVNSFCQKVLKKHWPSIPLHSDITTLEANNIPDANIWCGGFPCQDVSLANQGKRKGLKGQRSGLFYTYAELVRARKPDWIIIENVPGLLNSHDGADFGILLKTLDELGYGVSWRVFDTKYFGTPQRRRRVYIVASYGNLRSSRVLFDSRANTVTDKSGRGERTNFTSETRDGLSKTDIFAIQHASIGRKHTAGPQAKGYRNDGESYTLDSRGSADAVCAPNAPYRVRETSGLSRELDSNRLRAIGNAVSVPIIEWIANQIIRVENERG